jgi:hypothetical protein
MKGRWMTALIGLGIAVAAPPLRAQGDPSPQSGPLAGGCDIAGSWVGSSPPIPGFYSIPLLVKESIVPTHRSGKRFTGVSLPQNGDATLGGLFPDADQLPGSVGTYVRSGPRTYRFTSSAHFVKSPPPGSFDRSEILYFWTLSGTVECLDANTRKIAGILSFYSNVDRPDLIVPPLGIFGVHDQDKDDDGFADEGELPFFSPAGFEVTFKRLPIDAAQ